MNTALIVEDDRAQAEVAARWLRPRNFEPIVAGTGLLGLELAREHRPDLVLLDLMLPDIDGFEVCRRLRSDPATMATPIVMITALSDIENRHRGFRVGANAYVTKPYGASDLLDAISTAQAWRDDLQRARLHGEIQVELNSQSTLLQDVNEFLEQLYASTPLSTDQIAQLRHAVLELGQNAIEWGNQHRVEKLVRIVYRVFSDRVEIVIRDQGHGFDMTSLAHAASPDDPLAHMDVREKLGLREGGFGLLICRGMVDELRYTHPGNQVTLIKRFPPQRAETAREAMGPRGMPG